MGEKFPRKAWLLLLLSALPCVLVFLRGGAGGSGTGSIWRHLKAISDFALYVVPVSSTSYLDAKPTKGGEISVQGGGVAEESTTPNSKSSPSLPSIQVTVGKPVSAITRSTAPGSSVSSEVRLLTLGTPGRPSPESVWVENVIAGRDPYEKEMQKCLKDRRLRDVVGFGATGGETAERNDVLPLGENHVDEDRERDDVLPKSKNHSDDDRRFLGRTRVEPAPRRVASVPSDDAALSDLLTYGECKEAFGSQMHSRVGGKITCMFRNLYKDPASFTIHTVKGVKTTIPPIHILPQISIGNEGEDVPARIRVLEHNSLADFKAYLEQQDLEFLDGLSAAYAPLWHFNPAHALFDGLYSIFVSLMLWNLADEPFYVFLVCGGCEEAVVEKQMPGSYKQREQIFANFAGKGKVREGDVYDNIVRFDQIVLGVGHTGQKKDHNGNTTLSACRELDACRRYRNRMYRSHGLEPPEPAETRRGKKRHGILIENKRIPQRELEEAERLFAATEDVSREAKIEVISWSPRDGQKQTGDFTEHLKIMRETDIHISGPGTGMFYQNFLPDGSVHINVGTTQGACQRNYMEEYMAEGSPYFRALYYMDGVKNGEGLLNMEVLTRLVREALDLLRQPFPRPVPVGSNLSPVGNVFKAYYWRRFKGTEEERAVKELLPIRLIPNSDQNGNSGWHDDFVCKPGILQHTNVCLMEVLRKSFDHHFPDHGSSEHVGFFGTGQR